MKFPHTCGQFCLPPTPPQCYQPHYAFVCNVTSCCAFVFMRHQQNSLELKMLLLLTVIGMLKILVVNFIQFAKCGSFNNNPVSDNFCEVTDWYGSLKPNCQFCRAQFSPHSLTTTLSTNIFLFLSKCYPCLSSDQDLVVDCGLDDPRFDFVQGQKISSRAYPDSCYVGTGGSFPLGVKLTAHLCLFLNLRSSGAVPSLPLNAFMVRIGTTLPLIFNETIIIST